MSLHYLLTFFFPLQYDCSIRAVERERTDNPLQMPFPFPSPHGNRFYFFGIADKIARSA